MGEEVRRERLLALAGTSREWNWPGLGLAIIHHLDDPIACRVYARYPDLVRGPMRANVTPSWWRGYPNLIKAAQAAGDEDFLDTLASRYATRISWKSVGQRQQAPDAEEATTSDLAAYYQAIRDRDAQEFSRRACNVLTRIPAYATFNQNRLLRDNDLARLLFVRSLDQYLLVPEAVQDLVEGSNIHVMMLAYRVLALPDARARACRCQRRDPARHALATAPPQDPNGGLRGSRQCRLPRGGHRPPHSRPGARSVEAARQKIPKSRADRLDRAPACGPSEPRRRRGTSDRLSATGVAA